MRDRPAHIGSGTMVHSGHAEREINDRRRDERDQRSNNHPTGTPFSCTRQTLVSRHDRVDDGNTVAAVIGLGHSGGHPVRASHVCMLVNSCVQMPVR